MCNIWPNPTLRILDKEPTDKRKNIDTELGLFSVRASINIENNPTDWGNEFEFQIERTPGNKRWGNTIINYLWTWSLTDRRLRDQRQRRVSHPNSDLWPLPFYWKCRSFCYPCLSTVRIRAVQRNNLKETRETVKKQEKLENQQSFYYHVEL